MLTTKLRLAVAGVSAAALLFIGAGGSLASSAAVPFKVTLSGSAVLTSPTTVDVRGSGNASHLGLISAVGSIVAHPEVPSDTCQGFLSYNSETLTAADGDTLNILSTDIACYVGPAQLRGTGHWTVQPGGTGRFADATGSGDFSGYADLAAQTIEVSFVGTISY